MRLAITEPNATNSHRSFWSVRFGKPLDADTMSKVFLLVAFLALFSCNNIAKAQEETTTDASISTETVINHQDPSSTTEASHTCDPNGKGTPDCNGVVSSDERYRNNWDPVHYFICQDGEVVELSCGTNTGFDPVTQSCVPWTDWVWYPPCANFEIALF